MDILPGSLSSGIGPPGPWALGVPTPGSSPPRLSSVRDTPPCVLLATRVLRGHKHLEIYLLSPGARSQRSRLVGGACSLPRVQGRVLPSSSSSRGPRGSWACGSAIMWPRVCLCSSRNTCHWIQGSSRPHLESFNSLVSAKTLSLNKVTSQVLGARMWTCLFRGYHSARYTCRLHEEHLGAWVAQALGETPGRVWWDGAVCRVPEGGLRSFSPCPHLLHVVTCVVVETRYRAWVTWHLCPSSSCRRRELQVIGALKESSQGKHGPDREPWGFQ